MALPTLAFGLLTLPRDAKAQQQGRTPRVGVIGRPEMRDALRQGLLEHGWIEGKNVAIEYRPVRETAEQFAETARELNGLKVDCIVASGNLAIGALKQAASGIPVIMAFSADPVGSGFVASLRRPGGNITGLTNINEALTSKRLELLKALNPGVSRIAVLKHPAIAAHDAIWKEALSSARSLGLTVVAVDFRSVEELEAAFAAIAREKAEGLLVPQSPIVVFGRTQLLRLAAKGRLPAVYQSSSFVADGGLMSYGPHELDLWRRSAGYVDKILKGAKPADLPVEQPTKFELVINRRTAKALGLTIPQSLLISADKVIE